MASCNINNKKKVTEKVAAEAMSHLCWREPDARAIHRHSIQRRRRRDRWWDVTGFPYSFFFHSYMHSIGRVIDTAGRQDMHSGCRWMNFFSAQHVTAQLGLRVVWFSMSRSADRVISTTAKHTRITTTTTTPVDYFPIAVKKKKKRRRRSRQQQGGRVREGGC